MERKKKKKEKTEKKKENERHQIIIGKIYTLLKRYWNMSTWDHGNVLRNAKLLGYLRCSRKENL